MSAQPLPPNSPPPAAGLSLESVRQRLRRANLFGLFAQAEQLLGEAWLPRVLEIEESERQRRSLERRLNEARLGTFKPLADFDYRWPQQLDRALLDELFTCGFLEQAVTPVVRLTHAARKLAHYRPGMDGQTFRRDPRGHDAIQPLTT